MKNKLFLFMLLGLFLISFASAALTDGLVTYWDLDETSGTIIDRKYINNGSNVGGIAGVVGKIGTAYSLDGNDYLNMTSVTNIPINAGARSFSIWFKSNNTNTYQVILGQGKYGSPVNKKEWYFYISNKNIGVGYAGTQYEAVTNLNNYTWYNLVGVYNGTATNIYLNGVNVLNGTAFASETYNELTRLGMRPLGVVTKEGIIGMLDEFGYWNRSLSDAEILELYNSEDGLAYPFSEPEGQIYSQSEEDNSSATYPKFYDAVLHFAEWVTNATSLSSYIFSWNNSGSWANSTPVVFSGSNWSNVTMNVTAVKDSNIGWYIWANDSEGKVNTTSIFEYLVRNSLPTSGVGMFNVSGTIYNGSAIKVNASIGDMDGLTDIDMVIATIQKNITISGITNTTPLDYAYYSENPILPKDTFAGLETSSYYDNSTGVLHQWYRKLEEDGTPSSFIAYHNSTNGINFTTDVNVTIPQMATIPRKLEYVLKVNSTYYMFMANFTGAESTHNLVVFNSTDKINWQYACNNVITDTGYQKNPAVWYNITDGVWHGLFEQGSGTFKVYYWNSSSLCSGWTRYAQQFGSNAGNADIKYMNGEFIVYYGDMSAGAENMNISVARGTNLNSLSMMGKFVVNTNNEVWVGTHISNPDVAIIDDSNSSFLSKYFIYFSGHDNMTGVAYDSTNRTFEEAHFGTTSGYNQNITLSQVDSTSEWSGTFTNTSYIGLYNLTKIYVNDTDNGLNYSSYSTISFTTQEVELNDTSCDVYFNTTSPITYPDTFIVYTNCSSDYTLYRNGTSISNGTTIDGVGTYNISVVRTTQAGYSITYDEEDFTITQDTTSPCDIYFNTTSPITFPSQFLVWTNCSSAYTLYRNGSSITNNSAVISGADAYNISVVRTDQQNYSSIFNEEEFRVLTLDDGCAMFFNETTPLEYPNTFTVWTNCSTGTLRRNNTEILNNSEQSLTFGTYNFSFQRTDTQNYTTNYVDEYFQITDTIVPTTTIRLPANTTYYTNNITINFSVADNNFANATYNINGTNMTTTSNETQAYATLASGTHTLYVWAVDGGWATDYDTSSFRVQTVNVTLNSPANNTLTISPTLISCSAETGDAFLKNVSLWNNATGTWHRNETQSGFSYIENFTNVSYLYGDNTYRLLKNISINGDLVYNYSNKVWINSGSPTVYFFAGFVYSNGTKVNTTVVNIDKDDVGLNNLNATYSYTNPDISKPVLYIEFWLRVTSSNRVYEGFDNVTVVNKTKTTLFLKNITDYTIWNCEYCSNNSNCSFAPSNYSLSIGPIINSYSFSDVYETQQTSYAINVSSNSSLTAATVFLNNTGYDLTNSSGIWNFTRTVPATAGNIPVKYQLTYAGNNYNTTTYYQTINPIALVVSQAGVRILNATAGFTTIYQNYSFKDEENSSTLLGNIPTSTFVYYLGNGTVNKTLTYINSSYNTNYSLAFSPNTLNVSVDPYIQYSASGYPQRVYDAELTNFTNSSTNTTLYLLSTDNGMYVTFQVINIGDQPLQGVEVNVVRTISEVSTNVGTGITGDDGSVTFWLNPDFSHTFTFEKSGYTTYTTTLTPTQSSYTITLGGSSSSSGGGVSTDYTRGIRLYTYPKTKELQNDTSYNFIFNITSSYWEIDSYGFSLRLSNGTIVDSAIDSTEGSGTSINYDVNNQSIIYMDYFYEVDDNYINGTAHWVISNSLNTDWSVKTFFEDTETYLDSGLFGIDNFGRLLISFLLLFLVVGIVGYKFGVVSPFFMSVLTFAVVFFLDVITGILPTVRGIEHLFTYVAGLIALLVVIWEVSR